MGWARRSPVPRIPRTSSPSKTSRGRRLTSPSWARARTPGLRFQITPASQIIYRQALREGLVEIFLDAGATFTSSTCGPCFGGHLGTLAGDEVCISSTNRNYPGRMGSPQAQVYLASPWTVTASAIHGEITDPRKV